MTSPARSPRWRPRHDHRSIVFLVDVDNTLLDNDRIQDDLKRHLEREFGAASRDRYWAILEALFVELGYRDYLGALQRYRVEHLQDVHLMTMSSYLVDYPFANRLYPGALDVLERLRAWGPTVILTDGDVVFQPRKVERSGIAEGVDGHVLLYADFVTHPRVVRVVALSGGYTREEGNRRLRRNHGVVASFSRALVEGLSAQQSGAAYNARLDASIQSIFEASNT